MSDDQPSPPPEVPASVADALQDCSAERLRNVAAYATALADHREQSSAARGTVADTSEETDSPKEGKRDVDSEDEKEREGTEDDEMEDRPVDPPEDVPARATITVKEINDNRYYYWQWRDGDQIRSQYEGPVDPSGTS